MSRQSDLGSSPVAFVLSFALLLLVAIATAAAKPVLLLTIVLSATLAAIALQLLFPSIKLLWIAFVNLIAVYASVFALIVEEVFAGVGPNTLSVGFTLPIALFLLGCWVRRTATTALIARTAIRNERGIWRALVWLVPVWIVGATTIALSQIYEPAVNSGFGFLAAMLLIGLIVLAVSRDVAIFLVDTGLLFEEFFQRIAHMVVPAFAFLTFYSLIVVVFASLYVIVSRQGHQHFRVANDLRDLSFAEALHFSVVTLSTVGYGDIVPASTPARALAAFEVVLGVMLLLFGVSEILEYARERRRGARHRDKQD